ncbi:MAG: TIGR03545 family protein [Bdellovibrionales bacterium]|nr:TIGR03545 family protein [Bdellovibrionales bacterium]
MANPSEKPRYKKKGPIRFEAIGPFAIVVGCIWAYFFFLFDHQLRWGLQYGLTQGNGAEVNVGYLKTSFWKASFAMGAIQVTDPENPMQNRVEVGEVSYKLSWDALLRGKFVTNIAAIRTIEVNTPRKAKGFIVPPSPPSESEGESKAWSMMKESLASTPMGEIGEMLNGFNPSEKIKDLGNLKSAARIQELKGQLGTKEQEWAKALSSVPGTQEIDNVKKKIASVNIGGSNPAEIQKNISTLQDALKEAQAAQEKVTKTTDTLVGDVNKFSSSVGEVDNLVKKDREDLERKLKLPKIDAKSIGSQLFGDLVMRNLGSYAKYYYMAKKYMPPKKKPEKKTPEQIAEEKARARAKGKNYRFPVTTGYPVFWLQKAEISSKAENTELGGNVAGELTNVSSDPDRIGKPAMLHITGEFPKKNVTGVIFDVIFDAVGDKMEMRINGAVGSYPVSGQSFSDSADLKFVMTEAVGSTSISGKIAENGFLLAMTGTYKNPKYDIQAKSKLLEGILKNATGSLPMVTLGAKLEGEFLSPSISITTNLASALEAGLQKQLQGQVAEARKKLDGMIHDKIGKEKAALTNQMNQAKAKVLGPIEEKKKAVAAVQSEGQNKLAQAQKSLSNAGKSQATDAIKKKLRF